jgi:hypothetical protein
MKTKVQSWSIAITTLSLTALLDKVDVERHVFTLAVHYQRTKLVNYPSKQSLYRPGVAQRVPGS